MATKKTTTQTRAAKKTTKKVEKQAAVKKGSATKKRPQKAPRGMSALDAAAKVLGESKQPMSTKEMIEAMAAKGYWKSPGGATPAATLYSAITREIGKKGKDARFKKVERGQFAFNTAKERTS